MNARTSIYNGGDACALDADDFGPLLDALALIDDPEEQAFTISQLHAAEGKALRAEPVAALFERGKAKLAGAFPALEDEMAGLSYGGGYEGPGTSPDRADAMCWAMAELMLERAPPVPRLRRL
jgi:phage terminase large subunit-like protein